MYINTYLKPVEKYYKLLYGNILICEVNSIGANCYRGTVEDCVNATLIDYDTLESMLHMLMADEYEGVCSYYKYEDTYLRFNDFYDFTLNYRHQIITVVDFDNVSIHRAEIMDAYDNDMDKYERSKYTPCSYQDFWCAYYGVIR